MAVKMIYFKKIRKCVYEKKKDFIYLQYCFFIFLYLQFGRDPVVKNTKISGYQYGYTESVSIIANKLFIVDKDKFTKQMIQKIFENSFENVRFSFDSGYPDSIDISIYMNAGDVNKKYEIQCTPKHREYDISDIKSDLDFFDLQFSNAK